MADEQTTETPESAPVPTEAENAAVVETDDPAAPSRHDLLLAKVADVRGKVATAKRQNDLAALADAVCELIDALVAA